MSPDDFHRYWREQHGPLFRSTAPAQRYVTRYEQNHATPENHGLNADGDEVSVVIRGAVPGLEILAVRAADRRRRLHLDYLAGRSNVATWRRSTGPLGVAAGDDDDEVIAAADDALDKLGL